MASIVQLTYIVALDTYRHYVKAAEKCFVTQPTLSMQVKKLEDELGVIIFDRSKQPLIPTPIGEKIIAQARNVLAEYNKIEELVQAERDIITGELTIGIIPTLAPYLLPKFIGKLTKKYPDLRVHVLELMTHEIMDNLNKDRLDAGILVTPLHEKEIIEKPLFYEKMFVYANREHPFSKKQKLHSGALDAPGLWLLTEGHCFRSQVMNLCSVQNEAERTSNFVYESGSIETLRKLVDAEGGFTLLPELAIKDVPTHRRGQVKSIVPAPLREVSLVYSRRYAKERLIGALSEEIRQAVPAEMLSKKRGFIVEWQ